MKLLNQKNRISTLFIISAFCFQLFAFSFSYAQTTIADAIIAIPPQFSREIGRGALDTITVKDITQNKGSIVGKVSNLTPSFVVYMDSKVVGTFNDKCSPTVKADRTFVCNLTGLTPARTYHYIAVSAVDDTTRLSSMGAFVTPPVSANLYVHKLSHDSVDIQAVISEGSKNPSIIYGEVFGKLANPKPMIFANGIYSTSISGLKANTNYYYVLQGDAYDNSGKKLAYSSILNFTTLPTPLPAVTDTITPAPASDIYIEPSFSLFDNSSLVKCGLKSTPSQNGTFGGPILTSGKQACGFPELLDLVDGVINLLLFLIAPIVFVIIMLYGGWLILTSAGSSESVTKARGMMTKAVVGLVISLVAWLLIKTILVALNVDTTIFPVFYR